MLKHYSKIVSTLALMVSLGTGGAYAATQVNGNSIKNHTIGVAKLTPAAVKSLHGANGINGLPGAPGAPGNAGPVGATGGIGPAGSVGGFNVNKVVYVTGAPVTIADTFYDFATVECPAGDRVIGGGFTTSNLNQAGTSEPVIFSDGRFGWQAAVWNDSGDGNPITATAHAVCAAP